MTDFPPDVLEKAYSKKLLKFADTLNMSSIITIISITSMIASLASSIACSTLICISCHFHAFAAELAGPVTGAYLHRPLRMFEITVL